MLVATGATGETSDETEVSLELARHFAKEKNLQLITCDVEDGDKVETAFTTLIDLIMSDLLPANLGGTLHKCIILLALVDCWSWKTLY